MTLLAPPNQALLDRVLAGDTLLDSLHAASELRTVATGDAGADVLDAFERGDELARLLLLPALALVPGAGAEGLLLDALDGSAREHAAWALGDRAPLSAARPALEAMRADGGFPGMLAELTLERWAAAPPPVTAPPDRTDRGLRIVQVFMQGYLDAGLTRAGAGDGGGLATLLVHLTAALAARPEVEHVTTLTRAIRGEGVASVYGAPSEPLAANATIERIAFGGAGYLAGADMWPHRAELEHALEAALRRLAPVDAVHLRFADVATFAAARVCERLGIPVHFTLAPDPHALIRRREQGGELDRDRFVAVDRVEHLVFRARLVERMRDQAHGLALLPRTGAREELEELLRLPADDAGRRVRTIAEGVPTAAVDGGRRVRTVAEGVPTAAVDGGRRVRTIAEGIPIAAVDAAARAGAATAAAAGLAARVRALPAERHGLPLILSVGRLHRVKGFPALLEAWAGAPELRGAFNLAIVGGDLERPTVEERAVLHELRAGAVEGLLLLGHRPHHDVIALMAAAQAGIGGAVGADGIYACASEKEEFGLALLEALASGLSVVGPALGGPPTFIDDGVTGVITDTGTVEGLRYGLYRAAVARMDPNRAARAMATARERFTIDAMAAGLVELYA